MGRKDSKVSRAAIRLSNKMSRDQSVAFGGKPTLERLAKQGKRDQQHDLRA